MKLFEFIKWKIWDMRMAKLDAEQGIVRFKEYGVRMYTGIQGSGKTASMVEQLDRWREQYPDALIITNFEYTHADYLMSSLNDLLKYDNGDKGIIYAIDELQNEFSCASSKDFPENLLGAITMQRKRRVAILATSQVFQRVAKPLREQCYEVVECKTFAERWTRSKCYDAYQYTKFMDANNKDRAKRKVSTKWTHSFVQSNEFRRHYDTYSVIRRMSRQGFTDKQWYEIPR